MGICMSNDTFVSENPSKEKSTLHLPDFKCSPDEKALIQKHFRRTVLAARPDLYHKVMLGCIHASPKMNEVIAAQEYCMRDLTQWPKLNRMCQAQKDFIVSLVYNDELDPDKMAERIRALGRVHSAYLKYGFKAHFLDIWRQQVMIQLEKVSFPKDVACEKPQFLRLMGNVDEFIVEFLQDSTTGERIADATENNAS